MRERRSVLERGRWSLAILPLLLAAVGACSPPPPESTGECWTLARVPGPEDLVVVPGADGVEDGLLVSSQDRRTDPQPEGAIWYVPLEPADPARRARRLTLRGRHDGCSFHPHGIDLVDRGKGGTFLYIINHHEPRDLAVERGCFDAPGKARPRASVASVEVFRYRDGELYFLQRLADPEVLTGANDLVALRNGDVWVTSPPAGALARLFDFQGWSLGTERSKVVRFDCPGPRGGEGRCAGEWHEVETRFGEPLRWVNGIEVREPEDGAGEPEYFYVASSGGERVHFARVTEGGAGRVALEEVGSFCLGSMPDNLAWEGGNDPALLVAAHPLRRRFTQHARSPGTPSPSEVHRLPPRPARSRGPCPEIPPMPSDGELVLTDSGGRVSAGSVAVSVGEDDLILGQVFEAGVVRCRTEPGDTEGGTQ